MSRFSLISGSTTQAVCSLDWSDSGQRPLGRDEAVAGRVVLAGRAVSPTRRASCRSQCAGFPGTRSRPGSDRSTRPWPRSGRCGTVQVIASSPKCSKHSWLDMPPMYLSRKYGIRWWVVTGRRSAFSRRSAASSRCLGVIAIAGALTLSRPGTPALPYSLPDPEHGQDVLNRDAVVQRVVRCQHVPAARARRCRSPRATSAATSSGVPYGRVRDESMLPMMQKRLPNRSFTSRRSMPAVRCSGWMAEIFVFSARSGR